MRARLGQRQRGFTYIGLLVAVVVLGILLTVVSRVWSFSEQRDKEQELLYIGDQYRLAIGAYFANGSAYPLTLEDLLLDKRTPVPRRYLRRLYRDPITNSSEWTLLKDPTGVGIMGVASSSKLAPIKRRNFADIEVGFANRECYCDWKFIYSPQPFGYHRYTVPGQGQYGPPPTIAVPVLPPSQ